MDSSINSSLLLQVGRLPLQVGRLAKDLVAELSGEVRFDAGSRALYAHDASNFRLVPIGVVLPRTLEDVVAAHRICHRYGAPIVDCGGGTGLSGSTVNHAVVIDHSRHLTAISSLDTAARTVLCEAGTINESVSRYTRRHGLVFGPDPATSSRCVIGGNIGNNSCGTHSVQAQLYGPGPARRTTWTRSKS
jgi:FAD/FMN-containing dehydrogenase